MPNLTESFRTRGDFYQKFNGSFFIGPDDRVMIVNGSNGDNINNHVACRALRFTTPGRLSSSTDNVDVPDEFFDTMARFATPDFGYRHYNGGKLLLRTSRIMSGYQRGISHRNVQVELSPFSLWLRYANNETDATEVTELRIAHMMMKPEFIGLTDGIQRMAAGSLASFAINAKMAVTFGEDGYDLWYLGRCIGKVDDNMNITTKLVNVKSFLDSTKEH